LALRQKKVRTLAAGHLLPPWARIADHHIKYLWHLFGSSNDRAADVIERALSKVLTDENAVENSRSTD